MKHFFLFLLFTPLLLQAQTTEEWKTLKAATYSIHYPSSWSLDTSGQAGTKLVILSPSESAGDTFKENINLIIQDIAAYKLDLDAYTKLSTDQIKTMITNSKILENKRVKQGNTEYQKVIYTGDLQSYNLTFEQYYFVIRDQAYILTFTAEQNKFKKYQATGEKMLSSFVLNNKQ